MSRKPGKHHPWYHIPDKIDPLEEVLYEDEHADECARLAEVRLNMQSARKPSLEDYDRA